MTELIHYTHDVRVSIDASTYDFICKACGLTDCVPGGLGQLVHPCPKYKASSVKSKVKKARRKVSAVRRVAATP